MFLFIFNPWIQQYIYTYLTHAQFPMISNISFLVFLFKHVQFLLLNSFWSCGQPYSVVNVLEVTSLKKTDPQAPNSYQMPMAAYLPVELHEPLLPPRWNVSLLHMVTIVAGFYVQYVFIGCKCWEECVPVIFHGQYRKGHRCLMQGICKRLQILHKCDFSERLRHQKHRNNILYREYSVNGADGITIMW